MKNKGFTLIELLGVVIILALLMIIVFPSIVNSVKNSSNKTDDLTKELIYNASDLFISNHINEFPKLSGARFVIQLQDLIDDGHLASPIKLSNGDDITNNKCVQVTYEDGYKYELKNTVDCVADLKCTLTDNDDNGIPSLSDIVTCDTESFYVMSLNEEENTVTMLSMYNLNVGDKAYEDGILGIQNENVFGWKTGYETYGHVSFSSENYWESKIDSYPAWIYTDSLGNADPSNNIYPYVSAYETYLVETLRVSTAQATLISCEQFVDLTTNKGNPDWLYFTTYWTGYATANNGKVTRVNFDGGVSSYAYDYNFGSGIRPVVTISTFNLSY